MSIPSLTIQDASEAIVRRYKAPEGLRCARGPFLALYQSGSKALDRCAARDMKPFAAGCYDLRSKRSSSRMDFRAVAGGGVGPLTVRDPPAAAAMPHPASAHFTLVPVSPSAWAHATLKYLAAFESLA